MSRSARRHYQPFLEHQFFQDGVAGDAAASVWLVLVLQTVSSGPHLVDATELKFIVQTTFQPKWNGRILKRNYRSWFSLLWH